MLSETTTRRNSLSMAETCCTIATALAGTKLTERAVTVTAAADDDGAFSGAGICAVEVAAAKAITATATAAAEATPVVTGAAFTVTFRKTMFAMRPRFESFGQSEHCSRESFTHAQPKK